MNTLNIKASELIAKLGVVVESEKFWDVPDVDNKLFEDTPDWQPRLYSQSEWEESSSQDCNIPDSAMYRAPNFQELIQALPEIVKHCSIQFSNPEGKGYVGAKGRVLNDTDIAHRLLDILIEDGMNGVSKEIIRLIE